MEPMVFNSSVTPSLGVEVELALVDNQSMALRSAMEDVIANLPPQLNETIKPELMQCYIEINSGICRNVAEAEADLRTKLESLERVADQQGLRLLWSATHPFSSWRDQTVTDNDRYRGLIKMLQDTARQLITFGLHVHVGVDSGEKAVMLCDRILRHLPTLLALSVNSPFWDGRNTGLASWRSKQMDSLPTAGLPPLMRNWSEYVWLINHLIETGYIESIREIWWDVRPHHNFGTLEIRICDIPGTLDDTMSLVALTHCLVKALSDNIDEGAYQHDCHPMMVRQNKWRAARFGLDATLVDSRTHIVKPARQVIRELVERLRPAAEQLECRPYLERVLDVVEKPNWSRRQLDILDQTGDPAEVVRWMTEQSRLTPSGPEGLKSPMDGD